MPRWLWLLLPDTSKARFKWFRRRNLPVMVDLTSLKLTKPHLRVRLLDHDDKIKPIVAYGKSLSDLTHVLELYRDRRPVVEIYIDHNEWSRFTPSPL
jgi:hypothetical protein